MDQPKSLGLVGFGSFGQFAAVHLAAHFELIVTDRLDRADRADDLGLRWGSIDEAAACSYVLLAVPVQRLGEALAAVRSHLRAGALVIEVGSVKVLPMAQMLELLPEKVEIVGMHPMFGPQSAADGLQGHRIALCPGRTTRTEQIKDFLEQKLGLEVVIRDADSHDREIARSQALAQFVGRAIAAIEPSTSLVRTPGYDHLLHVAQMVGEDSWELFAAIQNLNPYARQQRAELMRRLEEIERKLVAELQDSGDEAAVDAGEPRSTDEQAGAVEPAEPER